MRSMKPLLGALLLAVATGGPASAQTAANAPAACENPNANLPPALAGWAKTPVPVVTAHDQASALKQPLRLGERGALSLAKTETIKFAHAPTEQMPKQYAYSGMVAFKVPKDGNYSVMISEANWIDVIQNGQPIQSLDMRGRIPCVKYGKKIEFPLKTGDAVVQFFGAPYDHVDVLIAAAP